MSHDNDWNEVRYDLDKSDNFGAIFNSPWYSDAVYDKFSDAEFARRHAHARELMTRDRLDALILTGGPDIYSHGSGVTWGSGLIDERGMCQYLILPTIMHGLDLITSVPFVRCDRIRSEDYDSTMAPGMTYNMEITPVDKEGIYGIFFSRTFAITEAGWKDLTPYPEDEILVAGS